MVLILKLPDLFTKSYDLIFKSRVHCFIIADLAYYVSTFKYISEKLPDSDELINR